MSDQFDWNKILGSNDPQPTVPPVSGQPVSAPPVAGEPESTAFSPVSNQIEFPVLASPLEGLPAAPNVFGGGAELEPIQFSSGVFTTPPVEPSGTSVNPSAIHGIDSNKGSHLSLVPPSQDNPFNKIADEGFNPNMPAPVPKEVLEPEAFTPRYSATSDMHDDKHVRVTEEIRPIKNVHLDEILREAFERQASDIHITAGLPPMIRQDGEIVALPYESLTPEESKRLVFEVLSDDHLQKFEQTHELDFGYAVKGLARFRFNVYMQRSAVAGALRLIANRIPTFDELRLPPICRDVCKRNSGLILVTGPTGSGKSTTIAAMIDDINSTRTAHIMTMEDPIEYLHKHKRCMINQRELHSDTYSLHNALRAVLREDPDIILVGELRDLETIEAALTLAETGHLVFGTLHTRNAPASVDRIIDVFPSDQQDQIRVLLGNTLEAIISQQLLPKLGGGRCSALEIMLGVPAIRNLIREGKTHQMYSVIETNQGVGMQTMDKCLAELYRTSQVSLEECLLRSIDKETFSRLAKGAA